MCFCAILIISNTIKPFTNMKLWNFLIYLTNNEKESRHEELFDIFFLIINTIALISGIAMFIVYKEPQWIPVVVIEYAWAFDNMRNNRNY